MNNCNNLYFENKPNRRLTREKFILNIFLTKTINTYTQYFKYIFVMFRVVILSIVGERQNTAKTIIYTYKTRAVASRSIHAGSSKEYEIQRARRCIETLNNKKKKKRCEAESHFLPGACCVGKIRRRGNETDCQGRKSQKKKNI